MVLLLLLPYITGEISYMLQYALFLKFGSLYFADVINRIRQYLRVHC